MSRPPATTVALTSRDGLSVSIQRPQRPGQPFIRHMHALQGSCSAKRRSTDFRIDVACMYPFQSSDQAFGCCKPARSLYEMLPSKLSNAWGVVVRAKGEQEVSFSSQERSIEARTHACTPVYCHGTLRVCECVIFVLVLPRFLSNCCFLPSGFLLASAARILAACTSHAWLGLKSRQWT